jgi:hypothetical protein
MSEIKISVKGNDNQRYLKSDTIVYEHIKERVTGRRGRHRVGIFVGFLDGDTIRIGMSKANIKAGDEFDFNKGMRIALDRAIGNMECVNLPIHLINKMNNFYDRCIRYFQQAKYIVPYGERYKMACGDVKSSVIDDYIEAERVFLKSKGKDIPLEDMLNMAAKLLNSHEVDWLFKGYGLFNNLKDLKKESYMKSCKGNCSCNC